MLRRSKPEQVADSGLQGIGWQFGRVGGSRSLPPFEDRSCRSINRIGFGHWNASDPFVCFGAFALSPAAHVPIAPFRVSTDDPEIVVRAEIFVGDSRGNNDDIADRNLLFDSIGPAELHFG